MTAPDGHPSDDVHVPNVRRSMISLAVLLTWFAFTFVAASWIIFGQVRL